MSRSLPPSPLGPHGRAGSRFRAHPQLFQGVEVDPPEGPMSLSSLRAACRYLGGVFVGISVLSGVSAAQLEVKTVPWRGDPNLQHPVWTGGSLVLQGVAVPAVG